MASPFRSSVERAVDAVHGECDECWNPGGARGRDRVEDADERGEEPGRCGSGDGLSVEDELGWDGGDEAQIQREEKQEAHPGERGVVAGVAPRSPVATGDEQHRGDDGEQHEQGDDDDERPGEGERPSSSAEGVRHGGDEREDEDQRQQQCNEPPQEYVPAKEPRVASPEGVGERAEQPGVGVLGHCG